MLLGSNSSGGGSYALSNDLSDFFLSGEMHIAKIVQKSINVYIKKIIILNFGKQSKYPCFEFVGISDKAGIELANMLKLLVDSKIIVPDMELEESMRKRMGLPEISEEGQREIEESKTVKKEVSLSERILSAISNQS